jgi:Flp pilus assembly protein TadD
MAAPEAHPRQGARHKRNVQPSRRAVATARNLLAFAAGTGFASTLFAARATLPDCAANLQLQRDAERRRHIQQGKEQIMLKATLSAACLIALVGLSGPLALAASTESPVPAGTPIDPNYAAGKQALAAGDWKAAAEAFGKAVETEPGNANAQNLLAYSYRKLGNLDLAFRHYNEALRLEPDHRGAHEYIGEAYLMAGNLAKAEEHLKVLDRLCLFGCEEYSLLKKAVAEYKQKSAAK